MNALLDRLGVDPIQWRVLLKASLRIDFPMGSSKKTGSERRTASMLRFILFIYTLAGITPALIAGRTNDPLLAAATLTTTVVFMVASTLLMGEGTSIVSPNDHLILGFRPVTSRTYLAVRVAALLVRTFAVATAVALIPTAVFLLRGDGIHIGLALAALASAELAAIAATLAVVVMYGWVLKVAGPTRTMRYTGYMQLVASSVVWGGFLIVTESLAGQAIVGLSLSASWWWILIPPAWFGAFVPLVAGDFSVLPIAGAALAVLSIVGLGRLIRDKLSMEYTEHLSKLASVTTLSAPARRSGWMPALNDETRAVAILVRSQLEHDMKFRLSLISLVPITVIYMIAGGWPSDPFIRGGPRSTSDGGVVQLALLFIPMSLRQAIVSSEMYRAAWVFHVTPADRARLVLSSRNVITSFFLIPYLACLSALFAWSFADSSHALIHAGFLGLLSWMVLQFSIMVSPRLPFSMPHGKDTEAGMTFLRIGFSMAIGMLSYFLLVHVVYGHTLRMVGAALFFIALGLAMDWFTRFRVRRRPVERMFVD